MDLDDAAGGCDVRDRGFPFMMDGWKEVWGLQQPNAQARQAQALLNNTKLYRASFAKLNLQIDRNRQFWPSLI